MVSTEQLIDDLCERGFHIIENFLEVNLFQELCEQAKTQQHLGHFRKAKIGRETASQVNNTIRTDEIHWVDEHIPTPALGIFNTQIQLIINQLNRHLFLGIKEFEMHFASYKPGAFYKKHCDQFAGNKQRKISCVYYLNPDWQDTFGGELILYDNQGAMLHKLFPAGNRFICFNSELPHEVCLTQKTRYSLTGWMKSPI